VQDNANVRRLIKTDLNLLAANTKPQQEGHDVSRLSGWRGSTVIVWGRTAVPALPVCQPTAGEWLKGSRFPLNPADAGGETAIRSV